VEYQILSATGTTKIATVIDGQPQVSYHVILALWYETVVREVGTLLCVAVTVGAIGHRTLQVLVHVGAQYF